MKGEAMLSKATIQKFVDSAKVVIRKRTPEILTGVGIAGMVTTVVLSVKATPKALMMIEERKLDLDVDELAPVEVVKTTWRCYIPSVVTGAMSIACIIGASSVNMRRNAALATAYALSETTLKDYQEKVVETIGEKKESAVRDAIAKDKLDKHPVEGNEVIVTERGGTLCYEPLSGRYFQSDIDQIKRALNEINNMMLNDSYTSLNDFYTEVGLGTTTMGDRLGWQVGGGLIDIHYSTHLAANGEPCLVVDFIKPPTYDYDKWL